MPPRHVGICGQITPTSSLGLKEEIGSSDYGHGGSIEFWPLLDLGAEQIERGGLAGNLARAGYVCKEAYIDLEPDHPHDLPGAKIR